MQTRVFTKRFNDWVVELHSDVWLGDAFSPNSETEAIKFDAIWDTGATQSAISEGVASKLHLKAIGEKRVRTANGLRRAKLYVVAICLPSVPDEIVLPEMEVIDIAGTTDVLIGMDIIRIGDLAVTNADHKTCMSFQVPSLSEIDFGKESDSM